MTATWCPSNRSGTATELAVGDMVLVRGRGEDSVQLVGAAQRAVADQCSLAPGGDRRLATAIEQTDAEPAQV